MKNPFIGYCLLFLISACSKSASNTDPNPVDDDLAGPISRPASGYGADGTHPVASVSFESPLYEGKSVSIFYPADITGPQPVIFFSHPYGGEDSSYNSGLYHFIAKKGYTVVFAPYRTADVSVDHRYATLWTSFVAAARLHPELIDTTKVGFMGHSFGGGASFGLAYKAFTENGWGAKGRFIFSLAPWYAYQLTDAQLATFPSNTKLLVQVYEDDDTNDHRMAIDLFKHNNISTEEKDYLLAKTSLIGSNAYIADHVLPNSRSAYDAYDYYCVYRLLDALIDYSFNGSAAGKQTALGNGSAIQVTLPSYQGTALKPLEETDSPMATFPSSKYQFPCSNESLNPRIGYCD